MKKIVRELRYVLTLWLIEAAILICPRRSRPFVANRLLPAIVYLGYCDRGD